jgi:hypothetical protein
MGLKVHPFRTCSPGPAGSACRAAARDKPTPGSITQKKKANRDAHRKGPHSKKVGR